MLHAINIKNLIKYYDGKGRDSTYALRNLDLSIAQGSIFGLLGSNGAGKSTLINILAGTVVKTSGQVEIMGINIDKYSKKARSLIGVVPQEIMVDSFFPLSQALEFAAGYHGIRPQNRKTDELLKSLSLYDKRDKLPKQLSGGMRRRFLIARAMVHSPPVLILDEPTAGVDIELRDALWEYIRTLNAQGVTIIITTHYLQEAEELCDEIAFINYGEIIKQDKKDDLLQGCGGRYVDVEFVDSMSDDVLQKISNLYEKLSPSKIRFTIEDNNYLNKLLQNLTKTNIVINDLNVVRPDLEDIFKKVVHKK